MHCNAFQRNGTYFKLLLLLVTRAELLLLTPDKLFQVPSLLRQHFNGLQVLLVLLVVLVVVVVGKCLSVCAHVHMDVCMRTCVRE